MKGRARYVVIVAGLALAACGRTVGLGQEKDAGPGGVGGTPAGGTQGGGAGGAAAGEGGNAGTGGALGSAGTGGAVKTEGCKVPLPPPPSNPTPAERERAALVNAFCVALAEHGCIERHEGRLSSKAESCSIEERVRACEMDELYDYHERVLPECDDEWHAAIGCQASPAYALACTYPLGTIAGFSASGPCAAERLALHECVWRSGSARSGSVTGSRATCDYSEVSLLGSTCNIQCFKHDAASLAFFSMCNAPPGLPQACRCFVNGAMLDDYGVDNDPFFAADCRDAAQVMADGECVNRLDCCFTQATGDGGSQCLCTSDPPSLQEPSCEALAAARSGEVVDVCPKYRPQW